MNADLLAMLGGAGLHGGGSNRREAEAKSILSFKAGKMSTTLQPNGKYLVTPDPRRGLLSLTWTSSSSSSSSSASSGGNNNNSSSGGGILKLEWKDRRTRTVVDTLTIFPQDDCTYSKVDTSREEDRVFLLQFGNNSNRRFFYWMQDKFEDGKDEDNCVKMNMYMADSTEAAKAAGDDIAVAAATTAATTTTTNTNPTASSSTHNDQSSDPTPTTTTSNNNNNNNNNRSTGVGAGGLDNAALMQVMQGLGSTNNDNNNNNNQTNNRTASTAPDTPAGSQPPQGQVDALSNILENLGMPQPLTAATPPPATTNNTTTTATTTTGGTLTLADLQGAMAGLATTSPTTASVCAEGPPLSEVASTESVLESGILNDPTVRSKLIQLLPEEQRSEQHLEDNLRSPQVAQCLKHLSATLSEDHDSLTSVLANFQLPPPPPNGIITNPIQAFLDSVLQSVQDEKNQSNNSTTTPDSNNHNANNKDDEQKDSNTNK